MPSEAYSAVYCQYFAVHFIVKAGSRREYWRTAHFTPGSSSLFSMASGNLASPVVGSRAKVKDHTSAFASGEERYFGEGTSGAVAHEKINQDDWTYTSAAELSAWRVEGDTCICRYVNYRLWMVYICSWYVCVATLHKYWYLNLILVKSIEGAICSIHLNEIKNLKLVLTNRGRIASSFYM